MQGIRSKTAWVLLQMAVALGALLLAGAQNWPKR
jgi:hypothetical protein